VDGHVVVSGGENPVVGVGQDGGEGLDGALPGLVEHLGLQLGELVLQLGEVVGQRVDDAGVDGAVDALVRGAEVLGSLERTDKVAPELCLLCESSVVGVEVKMHLAHATVARHDE